MTMEVWCDPDKVPGGLGNLADCLDRIAEYWPGVQTVEPCLFERLGDRRVEPALDRLLREREEVPLAEGTPLFTPFRIPKTGETVRVFGKAIGEAAGVYDVVDAEPIEIDENGQTRSYNLTLKKKED
jgi:hypothetical protein